MQWKLDAIEVVKLDGVANEDAIAKLQDSLSTYDAETGHSQEFEYCPDRSLQGAIDWAYSQLTEEAASKVIGQCEEKGLDRELFQLVSPYAMLKD
jgi:hypothetical protein